MKKEFTGYLKTDQVTGSEAEFIFKRWTNYGKDRIYVSYNNGKEKAHIDLQNGNELVVHSTYLFPEQVFKKAYNWFFENYEVK